MSNWNKWILGGLGWAVGGPIGAIMGFSLGAITENVAPANPAANRFLPNDFSAALMVLCAAVMKADQRVMKSELEYVRRFFTRTFGEAHTNERMIFFREILKQEIAIGQVCAQVRAHVDPSSRLELVHLLFGLAASDGALEQAELTVLGQIATLIGVGQKDFESIRAMFVKNTEAAYTILEIERTATNEEVKKAYRLMAVKYHPDKVHHLGPEYAQSAQEKFKKINEAYEQIKKERGMN